MNNNIKFYNIFENDISCFEIGKHLNPKSIVFLLSTTKLLNDEKSDILRKILTVNEKALNKFLKNYERNNGWQKKAIECSIVDIDFYDRSNRCVNEPNRLLLLQKIAKVIVKNPQIFDPLSFDKKRSLLVLADDAQALEKLLEEERAFFNCDALLFYALKTNATNVAELLFDKYNPNIKNFKEEGDSLLYYACAYGHKNIFEKLINRDSVILDEAKIPQILYEACSREWFQLADAILQKIRTRNDRCNLVQLAFDLACKNNDAEGMLYLISKKVKRDFSLIDKFLKTGLLKSVDHQTKSTGDTLLHIAIQEADFETVKRLIVEYGANVNLKNNSEYTPLHYACNSGNAALVDILLSHGADMYISRNIDPSTVSDGLELACPWIVVAWDENLELMSLFVKYGVDVNYLDVTNTPASWLCVPDLPCLKFLISKGADIDYNDSSSNTSLLMEAIHTTNPESVTYLIQQGADVNHKNVHGQTALHLICEKGASTDFDAKFVTYFLEKGADINAKDKNGKTPLLTAIKEGNTEIALCLINKGADVTLARKDGMDPLLLSLEFQNKEVFLALLEKEKVLDKYPKAMLLVYNAILFGEEKALEADFIKQDFDPNEGIDDKRGLPLLEAIMNHLEKVALFLIDKGADVTVEIDDQYPLGEAISTGNTILVKKLLECEACVQYVTTSKVTELVLNAIDKDNFDAISVLVDHGLDVNFDIILGAKLIHYACRKNSLDLVKKLTEKNADLNVQDSTQSTPIDIAITEGFVDIALYLIEKKVNLNNIGSLLHRALSNKQIVIVYALLTQYDKVLDISNEQEILYLACSNGYYDIADLLIEKGLDIDAQRDGIFTALMEACFRNNSEIACFLLDKKANPNITLDFNRALENPHVVQQFLVARLSGSNALQFAITRKNAQIVKKLIDLTTVEVDGNEIIRAVDLNAYDIVKILLESKKFDINKPFHHASQYTPLHKAVLNNNQAIVELLLDHGADPNGADKDGNTSLHAACSLNSLGMFKTLRAYGADISITNNRGATPFHIACAQKTCDIVSLASRFFDKLLDATDTSGHGTLTYAAIGGSMPVLQFLMSKRSKWSFSLDRSPLRLAIKNSHTQESQYLLKCFENEFSPSLVAHSAKYDRDFLTYLFGTYIQDKITFMNDLIKNKDDQVVYGFLSSLIDMYHCHNEKEFFEVPTIRPEGVSLNIVLKYFEELLDENPSLKKSEKNLRTLIKNITNRIAFTATPKKEDLEGLERYYTPIENALLQCILIIEKEQDIELKKDYKTRLVTELSIAGGYCGDRYITTSEDVFEEIVNNASNTLENKILRILRQKRKLYLRQCTSSMDTHNYTSLLQVIGKEFGIPGHSMVTHTNAFTAEIPEAKARKQFYEYFTFANILDSIEQELLQESSQNLFKEWAIKNLECISINLFNLKMDIIDSLEDMLRKGMTAEYIFDRLNDEFESSGLFIFTRGNPNLTYPTKEDIRKKVIETCDTHVLKSLFESITIDNGVHVGVSSRIKREFVIRMLCEFRVFSESLLYVLPNVLEFLEKNKIQNVSN